jgi:hypothetical protein
MMVASVAVVTLRRIVRVSMLLLPPKLHAATVVDGFANPLHCCLPFDWVPEVKAT